MAVILPIGARVYHWCPCSACAHTVVVPRTNSSVSRRARTDTCTGEQVVLIAAKFAICWGSALMAVIFPILAARQWGISSNVGFVAGRRWRNASAKEVPSAYRRVRCRTCCYTATIVKIVLVPANLTLCGRKALMAVVFETLAWRESRDGRKRDGCS